MVRSEVGQAAINYIIETNLTDGWTLLEFKGTCGIHLHEDRGREGGGGEGAGEK